MQSSKRPNIFDYDDYRHYLEALLTSFPGRKKPISRAQLSKLLGYKSPRLVSMVIQGMRLPSRDFLLKLAPLLQFSALEFQYFELLVLRATQSRKQRPTEDIDNRIKLLKGRVFKTKKLLLKDFSHISEWYYLPIQQLVACPGFQESPEWISRKLRSKITVAQARKALERMIDVGILERDQKTHRLKYADFEHLEVTPEVPSSVISGYHRQVLQQTMESFDLPRERREAHSYVLRFDPAYMNQAREMILEFTQNFMKKVPYEGSNDVFQLGVYFFPYSDSQ